MLLRVAQAFKAQSDHVLTAAVHLAGRWLRCCASVASAAARLPFAIRAGNGSGLCAGEAGCLGAAPGRSGKLGLSSIMVRPASPAVE